MLGDWLARKMRTQSSRWTLHKIVYLTWINEFMMRPDWFGHNFWRYWEKEGWFGNGGGDTLYHNIGSLKDLFIQHWQGHLVHSPSCIVGLLFLILLFFSTFIMLLMSLYIKRLLLFAVTRKVHTYTWCSMKLFVHFGKTWIDLDSSTALHALFFL